MEDRRFLSWGACIFDDLRVLGKSDTLCVQPGVSVPAGCAWPGQTTFFTVDRGDGSLVYDRNGAEGESPLLATVPRHGCPDMQLAVGLSTAQQIELDRRCQQVFESRVNASA